MIAANHAPFTEGTRGVLLCRENQGYARFSLSSHYVNYLDKSPVLLRIVPIDWTLKAKYGKIEVPPDEKTRNINREAFITSL